MSRQHIYRAGSWLLAATTTAALTACGGSSNNNDPDPDPTIDPPGAATVTSEFGTKRLTLSWNEVSGATHYFVAENPDGSSGYERITESTSNLTFDISLPVHLTDWQNARYMVEACNSAGCTPSQDIIIEDAVLDTIGYLKADLVMEESRLGFDMAITPDGNTLAVGAPQYNLETSEFSEENSGAVFVYTMTDSGWAFAQRIENPVQDSSAWDYFGYALAISEDGQTLLVGSPSEDGIGSSINADPTAQGKTNSGAAFLYTLTDGMWQLDTYFKASNADQEDFFGMRVAMSADASLLAVSAPYEASDSAGVDGDDSDNSVELAGAVYTFEQVEGQWQQTHYIKPSTASVKENFCFDPRPPGSPMCYAKTPSKFGYGLALSASGDLLAVGAPGDNSASAGINGAEDELTKPSSGAVHILRRSADSWEHTDYIKSLNPDADDEFGLSLALSADGMTLAVAAPYEDSHFADVAPSEGLSFEVENETEQDSGAVYLLHFADDSWSHQAYLKAPRPDENDLYGWSLDLSSDGSVLAVGSPRDDSEAEGVSENWDNSSAPAAGAVLMYQRDQATGWDMTNYVKASNTDANDTFGRTLVLSADGETLAVAATGEDSRATGVGGDQSDDTGNNAGAIYIY